MKTPTTLILCAVAVLAFVAVRPAQAAFVAYYDFDEDPGDTTFDDTAGGPGANAPYDGTVARTDALGAEGKFGNAFQHVPGWVTPNGVGVVPSTLISDNSLDGANARTFSMWFNTPNWNMSDDPGVQLISCPGGIGGASMFMLTLQGSGGQRRIVPMVHERIIFGNTATVGDLDTWNHIVVAYDADSNYSTMHVYVNGVDLGVPVSFEGTDRPLTTAALDVGIGGPADGGWNNYDGRIDDLGVWNEALSAGKSIAMYNILSPNGEALGDYTVNKMNALFQVYDTGAPQSVVSGVGTLEWEKFTGLSGTAGDVTYSRGDYSVFFDDTSGIWAPVRVWDADTDTTDAQDGDGVWSDGGDNWWKRSGSVANVAWDNTKVSLAAFGADNATADLSVTVDGTGVTVGGIVFNDANSHKYTLTGGTITLAGGATIEANVDAHIASAIDGTAGLTKTGAGTLELTGANTYTGTTTVNAGTLTANAGTVARLDVPGGTANLNTPALDVNATGGQLNLNGNVTNTLTVTGGTVTVGAGATVGTADFSAAAGTVDATNPLAVTSLMKLPNGYTATYTSGGSATSFTAQSVSGSNIADNAAARTMTLSGGTLTLSLEPSLYYGFESGDLTGWTAITAPNGPNDLYPSNEPVSHGRLSHQGTYWIDTFRSLAGDDDGHSGILQSDSFILGTNAQLSFMSGGGSFDWSGTPDAPGTLAGVALERLVGGDWQNLFWQSGNDNSMPTTNWDASAYAGETVRWRLYDNTTGSWGWVGVDDIRISKVQGGDANLPNTVINVADTSTLDLPAGVTTLGELLLSGPATLTLSGATATGASFDNISATDDSSIAAGLPISLRNGDVSVAGAKTLTVDTTIVDGTSATALNKLDSGTLVLAGANTYTGATTISAGTLTLSGANTGAGGVTLSAGTLNINDVSALGATAGTFTISGGTIDNTTGGAITNSNDNAQTWDGDFTFTGTQDLNLGTGAVSLGTAAGTTRTITASANTLTVGGAISDGTTATGLTKAGAGTTILSGANTYTGATTVNAGTLRAGSATAFGPAANASLVFGPGSTGTVQLYGNDITVVGLNTDATVGTPIVGSGSGAAGTDTLTVNNATDNTFAGVLQNGGARNLALTKDGGGIMDLTGANTYTGGTTVAAGTLLVNNTTGSGTGSGAVNVGVNGTLGGTGTIWGATTISGHHTPGSSAGIQNFGYNLTYNAGSDVTWDLVANTTTQGAPGSEAFDQVVVGWDLDFAGATTMNLKFDAPGSAVDWTDSLWDKNQSWLVYDVDWSTSNVANLAVAGTATDWADKNAVLLSTARDPDMYFYCSENAGDVMLNFLVPADATLDQVVNLDDFARLRTNYGTGDTWEKADFNGDNTVNLDDFAILRNNYGAHTPEPATLALLGLGGLGLVLGRKRR